MKMVAVVWAGAGAALAAGSGFAKAERVDAVRSCPARRLEGGLAHQ